MLFQTSFLRRNLWPCTSIFLQTIRIVCHPDYLETGFPFLDNGVSRFQAQELFEAGNLRSQFHFHHICGCLPLLLENQQVENLNMVALDLYVTPPTLQRKNQPYIKYVKTIKCKKDLLPKLAVPAVRNTPNQEASQVD